MTVKNMRLIKMIRGLRAAPTTREYKEARIELQRLLAPLVAFLMPALAIAVLLVVTSVKDSAKPLMEITIGRLDPAIDIDLEPVDNPSPEDDPVPTEFGDENVIQEPALAVPVAPIAPPSTVAQETKPAPVLDAKVLHIVSPTLKTMNVAYEARRKGVQSACAGSQDGRSGDRTTESAVMKALRWLKKTQKPNGSWAGPSPVAMTGFAVLTYLAHGETPGSREFGETVARALDYLVASLHEVNGVVRMRGSDGNEYAFLIGTYALCEAYGMTKNPNAKSAAAKGLRRIIDNQSPTGGWDYKLDRLSTRDDLSFGGWALQAVKAGRMAGLDLAGMDACIKRAVKYLKTRAFRKGGFGYCAGNGPGGLTGTGCLALQLLGAGKEKEVRAALDYMRTWEPVWERHPAGANAQYYSYYAAQCKYQAGMRAGATPADVTAWKKWNQEMKKVYPTTQIQLNETIDDVRGCPQPIGYWQNQDTYHDPVMGTCLCALQLMVYYRYLPTTTLHAAEPEPDVSNFVKDRQNEITTTIDI